MDAGHVLHNYFPDRYWAVAVPAVLLLVGACAIITMIALVMKKGSKGKKKKEEPTIPNATKTIESKKIK